MEIILREDDVITTDNITSDIKEKQNLEKFKEDSSEKLLLVQFLNGEVVIPNRLLLLIELKWELIVSCV
jgi:hypothetical protein